MSAWTELYDEGSGQNYYLNTETNEVSWDKPTASEALPVLTLLEGWSEVWDESSGQKYYVNEGTGETSWDPPVLQESTPVIASPTDTASDWVEVADDTGAIYYFNSVTNETSWDKPAEWNALEPAETTTSDWVEQFDEGSGMIYYANATTGETRWDNPNAAIDTGDILLSVLFPNYILLSFVASYFPMVNNGEQLFVRSVNYIFLSLQRQTTEAAWTVIPLLCQCRTPLQKVRRMASTCVGR